MRSSELQAKIDAMEPGARAMYLRRLDELFVEYTDLSDLCFSGSELPVDVFEEKPSP